MQGWWKFSTRDAGFCQAALTVLSMGVALRDQPGLVLAAVPWPRGELGNGDVLAALMGLSCQRLQSVNKHSVFRYPVVSDSKTEDGPSPSALSSQFSLCGADRFVFKVLS